MNLPPERRRQIIRFLQGTALPALSKGAAQVLPLTGAAVKNVGGFKEIFPYGTEFHGHFEWMWASKDWTHIKIKDVIYPMAPGDFCLIPPGVAHAEVYSAQTPPHQSLWFSYDIRKAVLQAVVFDYDSVGHGRVIGNDAMHAPDLLGTILVALQNEIHAAEPHAAAICRTLLSTLALLIVRSLESSAAAAPVEISSHVVQQVMNFLRRNYERNISLHDVARDVGLSPNYLTMVFKRETGKTITQALTEIRLERARVLLIERKPVRDVALAVGFRNPEHFCRVFKRAENIAPSLFSRELR